MKKILFFLSFCYFGNSLFSQKIVSVTHQETLTTFELSGLLFGIEMKNGIEAFKVLYETPDTDGSIDTASGLMVLPLIDSVNQQFPFLAYQHGTASDRLSIPSNPEVFERRLVYYFAGQGYYATAADYLGLGDSRRAIHPYVHAGTEASAGIDLVKAAKSYVEAQNLPHSGQLFITGYSQGGHAGMAMHKVLNDNQIEGLPVTAGSHMSGIYNVSGELVKASVSEDVYLFPSYPVWILIGYQSVYGNLYEDLSEVFQSDYLVPIKGFVSGSITRSELNGLLISALEKNHEASIPRYLFTDAFLASFENDPNSPFRIAMEDNNLFDWVPTAPMRMMYCMADDQVAFTNSTFTDSVMNANGAEDVMAIDVNSEADHGGCVFPAVLETNDFFMQFANRDIILSANQVDPPLQFQIYPNPANTYIQLTAKGLSNFNQVFHLRLITANGQTIQTTKTNNLQNFRFQLNDIPSGLYLMQVQSENGFWTEKVMVKN